MGRDFVELGPADDVFGYEFFEDFGQHHVRNAVEFSFQLVEADVLCFVDGPDQFNFPFAA